MSNRDEYTPGAASGAEVRKDGDKRGPSILVRELAHPHFLQKFGRRSRTPRILARMGAVRLRTET